MFLFYHKGMFTVDLGNVHFAFIINFHINGTPLYPLETLPRMRFLNINTSVRHQNTFNLQTSMCYIYKKNSF